MMCLGVDFIRFIQIGVFSVFFICTFMFLDKFVCCFLISHHFFEYFSARHTFPSPFRIPVIQILVISCNGMGPSGSVHLLFCFFSVCFIFLLFCLLMVFSTSSLIIFSNFYFHSELDWPVYSGYFVFSPIWIFFVSFIFSWDFFFFAKTFVVVVSFVLSMFIMDCWRVIIAAALKS